MEKFQRLYDHGAVTAPIYKYNSMLDVVDAHSEAIEALEKRIDAVDDACAVRGMLIRADLRMDCDECDTYVKRLERLRFLERERTLKAIIRERDGYAKQHPRSAWGRGHLSGLDNAAIRAERALRDNGRDNA